MSLNICPHCGGAVDKSSKYCHNCFLPITQDGKIPMPSRPGNFYITYGTVVGFVAAGLFGLALWSYPYSGWLFFGLIGTIALLISFSFFKAHVTEVDEYQLAETDFAAYQELMKGKAQKRIELKERQKQEAEDKELQKYNYYKYKCPMCGSNKIMNISTSRKVVSSEVFGLGSKTLGRIYHCEDCNYKW